MESVTEINEILIKRLKEERSLKKISQEEFGKFIGIDRTAVNKIENFQDGRKYKLNQVKELANKLNVSVDYLIGNVNSKKVENLEISKLLGIDDKAIDKMKELDKENKNVINYFLNENKNEIWDLLGCNYKIKELYMKFNSLIEYLDRGILKSRYIKDYYPLIKEFIKTENEIENNIIKGEFKEGSQEEKDQLNLLEFYYKQMVKSYYSEKGINQGVMNLFNHIVYKYNEKEKRDIEKFLSILEHTKKLYYSIKNQYRIVFNIIDNIYIWHLEDSLTNISTCLNKEKIIHSGEIYNLKDELIENKEKIKKINVILSFEVTQKISNFMDIK